MRNGDDLGSGKTFSLACILGISHHSVDLLRRRATLLWIRIHFSGFERRKRSQSGSRIDYYVYVCLRATLCLFFFSTAKLSFFPSSRLSPLSVFITATSSTSDDYFMLHFAPRRGPMSFCYDSLCSGEQWLQSTMTKKHFAGPKTTRTNSRGRSWPILHGFPPSEGKKFVFARDELLREREESLRGTESHYRTPRKRGREDVSTRRRHKKW